jgi:O-antigen ligase
VQEIHEIGPPSAARFSSSQGTGIQAWAVGGLSLLLLLLGGVTGGGRGGLGDTAAQLLALVLIASLALQAGLAKLHWRAAPMAPWLVALVLVLPLLHLLPVPFAIWSAGPARSELAAQMNSVGVSPLQVLSLNPDATERAVFWLLPACALFLATLTLPLRMRLALAAAILVLAAGNVLLGMAQVADGRESSLRPHWPTNVEHAVGFFANRNHFASLLAMALPLSISMAAWALVERPGRKLWLPLALAGCGLVPMLMIGIALSGSRAGLLLAMLGMLGAWPIVMGLRRHSGARRVLVLTLAVSVLVAVQFSMLGVLKRLGGDSLEEGRWQYARVTREAAAAYLPWGSGIGTFRQAYQPFEARAQPGSAVINHAHNDYVELWLEGGIPALVLILATLGIWSHRGWRLFRSRPKDDDRPPLGLLLAQTAWLSGSLALIHSALDYPLRTTAAMTVFGVFAALAFTATHAKRASSEPRG